MTEFWARMESQFGSIYAASVATDQALRALDGCTADQALKIGVAPKVVWHAVCEAYEIPKF